MSKGGTETEGDTESKAGSRLWAVSTEPDAGLEPTDREIITWAAVGRPTNQATQAPQAFHIFTHHDFSLKSNLKNKTNEQRKKETSQNMDF